MWPFTPENIRKLPSPGRELQVGWHMCDPVLDTPHLFVVVLASTTCVIGLSLCHDVQLDMARFFSIMEDPICLPLGLLVVSQLISGRSNHRRSRCVLPGRVRPCEFEPTAQVVAAASAAGSQAGGGQRRRPARGKRGRWLGNVSRLYEVLRYGMVVAFVICSMFFSWYLDHVETVHNALPFKGGHRLVHGMTPQMLEGTS